TPLAAVSTATIHTGTVIPACQPNTRSASTHSTNSICASVVDSDNQLGCASKLRSTRCHANTPSAITASRTTTRITSQGGTSSRYPNTIMQPTSISLSAAGSSIEPSLLCQWNRRASQPSTPS